MSTNFSPRGLDVTDASSVAVEASRNAPVRRRRKLAAGKAGVSTVDYHELPDYLQDNEFIKKHYRVPEQPLHRTLRSLFDIHNETGNVWTHLIGFILFAFLTVYVITLPPVPLSLGKRQIDHLWLGVQHRVHDLGQNLHNLQERLPHLPDISANLHHLHESLQHRVDTLVHDVQEEVHYAAQALHTLGDNIYHAKDRLNTLVQEALADALLWPVPRWPVYVFMAGAMTCLLTSAVCHLLGCCSKHVAQLIWRFDYAGIAVLIVASFYPPVYYGFLCQRYWRLFYLATTSVMGAGAVAVSLLDVFQQPQWRATRAGMFAGLGLWGAVPVVHTSLAHAGVAAVRQATWLIAVMGALYLAGAFIYAARVPERWLPGRFDVWLHGHQIFHVLIVVAAFLHYRAVMLLLHWRDETGGCAAAGPEGAAGGGAGVLRTLLLGAAGEGPDVHRAEQLWESLREYLGSLAHSAAHHAEP